MGSCDPIMSEKTILFSAIRPFGILRSRLHLVRQLIQAGWCVVAATVDDNLASALRDSGVLLEHVPFHHSEKISHNDLIALKRMIQLYRKYQPRLIHLFHAKPILFGSLVAFAFRKPYVVVTITGLGYAADEHSRIARLYEIALGGCLKRAQVVIFQNPDDYQRCVERKIVASSKARLILSSGVDMDIFKPRPARLPDGLPVTVLMASRLQKSKGVGEYLEAARLIAQSGLPVQFQLAGEWDEHHPDGIDRQWLLDHLSPSIEFLGYISNMPEHLHTIDILVLPSYYREGVPRILLEAGACAIPVVTTDVPGCKEAVLDGKTGILVPPRDSRSLADAILKLASNASLRQQMGERGRAFIQERFDILKITQQTLDVYRELGLPV